MALEQFERLVLGTNLTGTDNGDGSITIDAASGGIPSTLLDAKGDLIAASAADTAARLAIGSNGQVLTADSGETTGMRWGAAAGGGATEVAYVEFTSTASVTATVEASGNTIVSAGAVTYTAVKHKIEFWAAQAQMSASASGVMIINLWDGGTNLARIGYIDISNLAVAGGPVYCSRYITPTAASHTYIIKAWVSGTSASGSMKAGVGSGGSAYMPGYIRVSYGG